MGAIARSASNLVTTSGVWLKGGVNNDSFDNVTALPSSIADGITFISSQTASNSASLSFTSGLTSTYKAYKFVFSNIHGRTEPATFSFNLSTDSGSNYNVTKTSTFFRAYANEGDTTTGVAYDDTRDLEQSTAFQLITADDSSDADHNVGGSLILFNPSSTTYVKHFISIISYNQQSDFEFNPYVAGYANTTSAINAIQFKYSAGNFDGKIYMYGIK